MEPMKVKCALPGVGMQPRIKVRRLKLELQELRHILPDFGVWFNQYGLAVD